MSQNSLQGMLRTLLSAYGERISIKGEDVEIDDRSATPLALIFHELATNAAKYGGLSVEGASVLLHRQVQDGKVILSWREQGGPDATLPVSEGFGSSLIKLSLVNQMAGKIEREWKSDGLRIKMEIPRASLLRPPMR